MPRLILNLIIAVTAAIAAAFWLASALVKMPKPAAYYDETPDDDPFVVAFKIASTRNKWAAIFASASAAVTAFSVFVQ